MTALPPTLTSCSRRSNLSRATALVASFLLLGCAAAPKPVSEPQALISSLPIDFAEAFGAIDEVGAAPVVQVRDFRALRTVSVLGHYDENATYGLRAEVRPDGQLTSPRRLGDHRLYINSYVVRANGGFRRASVGTRDYPLVVGYQMDPNACFKARTCSPYRSVTLGIPDSVLRNSPDGMIVMFERHTPTQWQIVFSPKMITTYLATVDSVAAARRTSQSLRATDR